MSLFGSSSLDLQKRSRSTGNVKIDQIWDSLVSNRQETRISQFGYREQSSLDYSVGLPNCIAAFPDLPDAIWSTNGHDCASEVIRSLLPALQIIELGVTGAKSMCHGRELPGNAQELDLCYEDLTAVPSTALPRDQWYFGNRGFPIV